MAFLTVEIDQLKIKMAEDNGFYNEEAERLMKCCDQSDTELDEMTRKYNQVNGNYIPSCGLGIYWFWPCCASVRKHLVNTITQKLMHRIS